MNSLQVSICYSRQTKNWDLMKVAANPGTGKYPFQIYRFPEKFPLKRNFFRSGRSTVVEVPKWISNIDVTILNSDSCSSNDSRPGPLKNHSPQDTQRMWFSPTNRTLGNAPQLFFLPPDSVTSLSGH
jgi:hypothetical protein